MKNHHPLSQNPLSIPLKKFQKKHLPQFDELYPEGSLVLFEHDHESRVWIVRNVVNVRVIPNDGLVEVEFRVADANSPDGRLVHICRKLASQYEIQWHTPADKQPDAGSNVEKTDGNVLTGRFSGFGDTDVAPEDPLPVNPNVEEEEPPYDDAS